MDFDTGRNLNRPLAGIAREQMAGARRRRARPNCGNVGNSWCRRAYGLGADLLEVADLEAGVLDTGRTVLDDVAVGSGTEFGATPAGNGNHRRNFDGSYTNPCA